jgi:hypothetical protein
MIPWGRREDAHFQKNPGWRTAVSDKGRRVTDHWHDPPPLCFCTRLHNFTPAFQENIWVQGEAQGTRRAPAGTRPILKRLAAEGFSSAVRQSLTGDPRRVLHQNQTVPDSFRPPGGARYAANQFPTLVAPVLPTGRVITNRVGHVDLSSMRRKEFLAIGHGTTPVRSVRSDA